MSIEIKYVLPYREKGKAKTVEFKIDFTSNWVVREFNNIMQMVYETQKAWNAVVLKSTEIKYLQETKPEGYYEKVETLYKELKELTDGIQAIGDDDILQRRYELIKTILIDNGVTDEKILSFEFWDKNVEPDTIIDFLEKVSWKDIDKKKIQ
jgi:hypothetical protein